MNSNAWWRISDDAAFVLSSAERVVVLNLAAPAESPRALLGTAASVWHALAGEGDDPRPWVAEQDLLDDLAAAYATEATVIADDVRTLLEGLVNAGYVQLSPEADDSASIRRGDGCAVTANAPVARKNGACEDAIPTLDRSTRSASLPQP